MSIVTVNKEAIAKVRAAFEAKQLFRQAVGNGTAKYGGSYPCAIGVMMSEEVRIKADHGAYGGYTISQINAAWNAEELGQFFSYEGELNQPEQYITSMLANLQLRHDAGDEGWEDRFNYQLKEIEAAFS